MRQERTGHHLKRLRHRVSRRLGRVVPGGLGMRWRQRFRRAVAAQGADEVLRAHPAYARLPDAFSIGGYLMRNPDVMDATEGPAEALFHYLEYGMAEGRAAEPDHWSPSFVRAWHGRDLSPDLSPVAALGHLRAAGIGPLDARLSGADHWLCLGLHGPALEPLFDHETYAVLATAAGHPPGAPDRLTCIDHAVRIGLPEGIPLHPDHRLDPEFYRAALRMRGVAQPAEGLSKHWARIGLRCGAQANPGAQIGHETGLMLPSAVQAALPAFRAASPALPGTASEPEILRHLIECPVPGVGAFDLSAPETVRFLHGLARHVQSVDQAEVSEAVLERLCKAAPRDGAIAGDLADLKQLDGRLEEALDLREVAFRDPQDVSNDLAHAELLGQLGRTADAIRALPPVMPHPVKERTAERRQILLEEFFSRIMGDLSGWIDVHGLTGVQDFLTKILTLAAPVGAAGRRPGAIRTVAILARGDLPQCHLYRAAQTAEQLRAAGCEVTIFDDGAGLDALEVALWRCDALICVRVAATPRVATVLARARAMGVATFYDADDPVFDAAIFPPPLASYAGRITARERDAIACGVPLFACAMALCDTGIAATPALRAAMAPRMARKRAILRRNGLGGPHARCLAATPEVRAPRSKVVLFHGSATLAHKTAFHDVLEPALARVLAARRGRVSIQLMGQFGRFTRLDPVDPDVQIRPPIPDFEAYAAQLGAADIALGVLDDTQAAQMKSEVKWLEAAMFGIPCIASDAAPFRDVIADGRTGFLCRDAAAFEARMVRLIDDAALRRNIGQAARSEVLRDRDPARMGRALLAEMQEPAPVARKTRLLLVNVFFPPHDEGGATHVVRDQVRAFRGQFAEIYDLDIIAVRPDAQNPYDVACAAWEGARVWTIGAPPGGHVMALHDTAMGDAFDGLLRRIAPDLVHFHCIQHLTLSVVDAVRQHAIPYLVSLHDGWWISPEQFISSDYGDLALYDYTGAGEGDRPDRARILLPRLRGAAALLSVSEPFARLHRAAGLTNVETVENGLCPQPDPAVRSAGPPGRVRVGHVGGAVRPKGFALLRAAVESMRLSHVDLSVIDHTLAPGTQRREVWNGTPVTMLPRVAPDRMAAHYGSLDVLVAPSVWPESYGLVTREAAAAGLWVVASDRGAVGEAVIEGKTGHVVSVDGPDALAACLRSIDADPARYTTPPPRTPPRPSSAQADALHGIYQRILGSAPS